LELRQLRYFLDRPRRQRRRGRGRALRDPARGVLQLQKLEADVGQKPLLPGRRMIPTDGVALAARADEILRSVDALHAELRALDRLEHGTCASGALTRRACTFARDLPRVSPQLSGRAHQITVATRASCWMRWPGAHQLATATLPVEGPD
jgi:DNA-binding transcriptional LysR family regulator